MNNSLSTKAVKLSIIVPVYNEESTVMTVVERLKSVDLSPNVNKEIILVNDGSTDRTRAILGRLKNDPTIKILHNPKNLGKTHAIRQAIEASSGEILIIQDADLEYAPRSIAPLIRPLLDQEACIVFGSRFKGSVENMTLVNRWANIISNITFNCLYSRNLTDINTCYKAFKKSLLNDISITSNDFTFETEITAKFARKKYDILELPINYQARTYLNGKKMDWIKALRMYWGIIYYRFSKT